MVSYDLRNSLAIDKKKKVTLHAQFGLCGGTYGPGTRCTELRQPFTNCAIAKAGSAKVPQA